MVSAHFIRRRLRSFVDGERIAAALSAARAQTDADIGVTIASHITTDALSAARALLAHHGLANEPNRAGVLFLVVPSRHQFAVYGDEVAHTRLGDAAWLHVAELVEERLRAGDATGALERGIAEVAAQLAAHDSAAN